MSRLREESSACPAPFMRLKHSSPKMRRVRSIPVRSMRQKVISCLSGGSHSAAPTISPSPSVSIVPYTRP